jgi:hypothetical protein
MKLTIWQGHSDTLEHYAEGGEDALVDSPASLLYHISLFIECFRILAVLKVPETSVSDSEFGKLSSNSPSLTFRDFQHH